jgi:hypothetical protein
MKCLLIAFAAVLMPTTAAAQSNAGDVDDIDNVTTMAETVADAEVPVSDGTAPEGRAETSAAASAAAQPSAGNFLYQVLLAAVTALITALIWRAVF